MLSGDGKLMGPDRSCGAGVATTVGALAGSVLGLGVVTDAVTCESAFVSDGPDGDLRVDPGRIAAILDQVRHVLGRSWS
jgi:hypothetical protein